MIDAGGRADMRRFIAALGAVVLVVTGAGCSSNSGDPAATSFTASSVTASAPSSLSAPSVPTGAGSVATPSVIALPTPASSNPWPADLTPDQVADAQAAIAAYRGYWQMVDLAVSTPGQDWSVQASQYAMGPAKVDLLESLGELAPLGEKVIGTTAVSPHVTSVEPGVVVIADCVDKTATDILDSAGISIKAPDVAGSYFRHPSTAQMTQLEDGRWVVALQTDDWSQTC